MHHGRTIILERQEVVLESAGRADRRPAGLKASSDRGGHGGHCCIASDLNPRQPYGKGRMNETNSTELSDCPRGCTSTGSGCRVFPDYSRDSAKLACTASAINRCDRFPVTAVSKSPYYALALPQECQRLGRPGTDLRKHIVDDVAFHGWPSEWVHSAPKFHQVGTTESRSDYRISKFRYEIVPGFFAPAVLYEPEKVSGHVPAILNVIGHEPMGNAAEYEQKRCINFAKRGIIALSLGWVGFGEMALKGNDHDDAAALDLVGSNALGFFYLGMRRGLDYL